MCVRRAPLCADVTCTAALLCVLPQRPASTGAVLGSSGILQAGCRLTGPLLAMATETSLSWTSLLWQMSETTEPRVTTAPTTRQHSWLSSTTPRQAGPCGLGSSQLAPPRQQLQPSLVPSIPLRPGGDTFTDVSVSAKPACNVVLPVMLPACRQHSMMLTPCASDQRLPCLFVA